MSLSYQITAMLTRYLLVLISFVVLVRVITLANSKKANIDQSIGTIKSLTKEREYPLFYDNTIGRSGKCDIQIRNKTIDSLHAQIYNKKGKCYLLAYSNGTTLLNGIEVKDKIDIQNGDVLRMGDEEFVVELLRDGR